MAALKQDENPFSAVKNAASYHTRTVTPSTADEAPLESHIVVIKS